MTKESEVRRGSQERRCRGEGGRELPTEDGGRRFCGSGEEILANGKRFLLEVISELLLDSLAPLNYINSTSERFVKKRKQLTVFFFYKFSS